MIVPRLGIRQYKFQTQFVVHLASFQLLTLRQCIGIPTPPHHLHPTRLQRSLRRQRRRQTAIGPNSRTSLIVTHCRTVDGTRSRLRQGAFGI